MDALAFLNWVSGSGQVKSQGSRRLVCDGFGAITTLFVQTTHHSQRHCGARVKFPLDEATIVEEIVSKKNLGLQNVQGILRLSTG